MYNLYPLLILFKKKPAKILWIEREKEFWVFTDSNGKIFKINLPDFTQESLMETNSGKLMDLALS